MITFNDWSFQDKLTNPPIVHDDSLKRKVFLAAFLFAERGGCIGADPRHADRRGHFVPPTSRDDGRRSDFRIVVEFRRSRSREEHVIGRNLAPMSPARLHMRRSKLPGVQGEERRRKNAHRRADTSDHQRSDNGHHSG